MTARDDDRTPYAHRASRLMSHLEGALADATLDAMQEVWAMLECAAADAPAHARAVRSRLFWRNLTPRDLGVAPRLTLVLAPAPIDEVIDIGDELVPFAEAA